MGPKWTAAAMILMISVALAGCTAGADVVRAFQVVTRAFQTTEVVEESHRVQPGSSIEIRNLNGDIVVKSGGDREVHVRATKRAFGSQDEIDRTEVVVTTGAITTIETEPRGERSRVAVDYEVTIPPGVALKHVQTSNGLIRVEDVAGDVVATTSNGSIHLEGIDGYVRATTSNGSIHIVNCTGIRSSVQTSNGSIHVEVADIEGSLEIRTGNGSITAYLSHWLEAEVEMTVSNGRIVTDHNGLILGQSSQRHVRGHIGDQARHKILIRTSNGTVTVRDIQDETGS